MEDAGSAGMHVVPTFDGFESAVDRGTSGALTSAGRKGGRLFGNSAGRSVATSFTSHVRSAVGIASGLLAGVAVKNFIGDSIAEGRDSLKVAALTRTEIRALGDDAGITAKHVGSLATALSHKAAIDDEQIQSGLNVIVTYKNVRNEVGHGNAIFDRAAKASTNLAAALASQNGGTPNIAGASKTVGKALADPVKGIASLRKAQIFLTQSQQDNIKSMVAQGDTLGAQKVLLKALEDRYTGVAASQATAGEKVAVAWGNIEEKLGKAILPLVDDVEHAILTKGMPAFRHWVRDFEDRGIPAIEDFSDTVRDKGLPMLKELVKKGRPLANEILPAMGTALGVTADALSKAAPYATDMVDAFNNAPDWVKKGTVFAALAAIAGKKTGAFSLLGGSGGSSGLLGLVSKAKPLPVFVVNNGIASELAGGTGAGGKGPKLGPARTGLAALLPILPAAGAIGADHNTNLDSHGRPIGKHPLTAAELEGVVRNANGEQGLGDASKDLRGLLFGPLGPGRKPKIEARVDLLGLDKIEADLRRVRRNAERPIEVPIVAKVNNALANLFGDAFGGGSDLGGLLSGPVGGKPTHGPAGRFGGITVNGGMHVQAHDYKDFQRQVQQRMQQQGIGAIGAMAS